MCQIEFIESSDLPIFVITTEEAADIPNEPKIKSHLGIIYNGEGQRNHLSDPYEEYDGQIAIEIRGNGSVERDKVSYAFETQDENGDNNNVSILGFPKENDWVLYAPETDKSFMRNILAYQLANEMGYYASRTRFCEVIVNDNYLGIFVFMEKIKRDKNRLDIKAFDEAEQAPEEGGFMVRIDSWWHKSLGWEAKSFEYEGKDRDILYQHVYPKADEISEERAAYIKNIFDDFEEEMYNANDLSQKKVYESYIDEINFADYFVINEFTKNPDGYRLSTFMHKDADEIDPRIKLGPIWDYNFGFGNYCCDYHINAIDWEFDNSWWDFPSQIPFWVSKIMKDPNFIEVFYQRWKHWRSSLISCENFESKIDSLAAVVDEAKERNFNKWPILGTNVIWDWNAGPSYEDETDLLKDWICRRIDWMDKNIELLKQESQQSSTYTYPNPCRSKFTLNFYSQEEEQKEIYIYNTLGALVYKKNVEALAGANEFVFEELNFQTGLYFLKIKDEQPIKLIFH